MKFKAAVIGCGRIASGFDDDPKRKKIATHIGAYQHARGIDVVAVCDVDPKLAEAVAMKRDIKTFYTDYLKMLREQKPDVVSVCTPPQTHAKIVSDIARQGLAKAIFCEKPMAASLKEARAMIDICKRRRIILQIGHQRRFNRANRVIQETINSGAWGKVQRANFYYTAGARNTGSHMFDLLCFFFGDADWVQAHASHNPSHRGMIPISTDLSISRAGLLASFQALDHKQYLVFELDCFFEKARLTIKRSGLETEFYKVTDSRFFSGYRELEKAALPFKTNDDESLMVRGVEEIIACVKTGRESISSGKDGLAAMELMELSLKSARQGGKRIGL